jgi:multidrug efflux pump subunit AcrA (membrane-fusion protein)
MKKIISFWKKLKKGQKIAAVIFTAALLFFGWRILGKKSPQPQYQTAKVEKGTIVWTVSASGSVVSANIFEVTTQATGMVKKVYVADGEKVKAGQKIMEIELDLAGKQRNASAWSAYLSAKNNLESAKATLWSLNSAMWQANQKFINDAVERELPEDDPTYIQENSDWLAAEAKYKNQQAVVSQAEVAVNNAWLSYQLTSPIITAPVSGTISGLNFVPGMVISSSSTGTSQRVAVIRTEGTPIASFNLSELDVPVVKPGQKATIKLDSLPDKTFTGKVVSVDRLGTTSNGVTNYPVIIQFVTSSQEVLPNMAASVNIIIEAKDNVLLVPSSAIQKQNGQNIVTVLENGKERQKQVEVGIFSDTQTEIISGLSQGEVVITGRLSGTKIQTGGSPFGMPIGGAGRLAR